MSKFTVVTETGRHIIEADHYSPIYNGQFIEFYKASDAPMPIKVALFATNPSLSIVQGTRVAPETAIDQDIPS